MVLIVMFIVIYWYLYMVWCNKVCFIYYNKITSGNSSKKLIKKMKSVQLFNADIECRRKYSILKFSLFPNLTLGVTGYKSMGFLFFLYNILYLILLYNTEFTLLNFYCHNTKPKIDNFSISNTETSPQIIIQTTAN